MPLSKKDNPENQVIGAAADPSTPEENREATNAAIDAAAGAPAAQADAAEALPEKDEVQKQIKRGLTADDAQTEARAKAKVVDESPNAAETPSGGALKAVAGIKDDVERGEAYAREKQARRWVTVPAEDES